MQEADAKIDAKTPILVGCGQVVRRPKERAPLSPIEMMTQAAQKAALDTGLGASIWKELDVITATRFIRDTPENPPIPVGNYANPALLVAQALHAAPRRTCYGPTGGSSPQYLVNLTAQWIAEGECQMALLTGAECLCAIIRALKAGEELDWNSSEEGVRMDLGEERLGSTQAEVAHGLFLPTAYYAIVENLLRARAGRSVQDHREKIGRLMAPFSEVAARHPQAWFPIARSAQEIAEPSKNNRYVGFPYTKYMNAIMQVDQGAALLMTSVGKAREMGIPREKWIFIHGTAHAHDIWHLSERERLDASPALRAVGGKALEMARWDIKDVDYFDLYSCFPSAVEVAQQELGIDEEDPRPLTVTGGLPYFGGCGNNYTMHAIATMMEKLRRHPQAKGLCTGNSYYLTRHAVGLYSAAPPEAPWTAPNMKALQSALDKAVSSPVAALPEGRAKIESWTVLHGREGAEEGIVIGRLLKDGARFIANTPPLGDALRGWMEKETLERVGEVMPDPSRKGRNLFLAD